MTMKIGQITFGAIKNVRKSGDEEGVYFADVEISEQENSLLEVQTYCARSNDRAPTGQWVYQQILDGDYEGQLVQLLPGQTRKLVCFQWTRKLLHKFAQDEIFFCKNVTGLSFKIFLKEQKTFGSRTAKHCVTSALKRGFRATLFGLTNPFSSNR